MSRRKKPQSLLPRTLRHLTSPDAPERLLQGPIAAPPDGRGLVRRLSWTIEGPVSFSGQGLAAMIGHPSNDDVQWYCDTNVFIAPTEEVIWDQLLKKQGRLALAIPVFHELEHWLDSPTYNRVAHVAIQQSLIGTGSAMVKLADFPREDVTQMTATEYYINLLGMRKKAHIVSEGKLKERLERDPTKQEISNYTKDQIGIRGQLLARKGDNTSVTKNKFNDEVLLVQAIFDAIHCGRETSILTYDEDVFEQFYKAMWLIDTHYRSMLFADRHDANPNAFLPSKRIQESDGGFEGEVLLLTKPSDALGELLPLDWTPISVHCILVKNNQLTKLSFCSEREMSRLFAIKGATGGLSTDRFGGMNCHIYLGSGFIRRFGNWAAIGRDIASSRPEWSYKLSIVDVNLVVMSDEQFTRRRVVDPADLILPPDYQS